MNAQLAFLPQPDTIAPFLTKSNEWYTPARYVEAARQVMGGIDLDPASCALANQTVKASRFYSEEQNGLAQAWYGRVFCNPPYGRSFNGTGTGAFVAKLIDEYTQGNVEQAIILTLMGMYARWFFQLLQYPICFLEQKPLFSLPDGTGTKHAFAACCAYLGANEQRFIDTFSQFGTVARRVSQPRPQPTPLSLWEARL